jgi:hypothetical protein
MPEYTHVFDGKTMKIDTRTGTVVLGNVIFHAPSTLESEDCFMTYTPVPLNRFRTVDFSRVVRWQLLDEGRCLAIDPAGWNCVFFTQSSSSE